MIRQVLNWKNLLALMAILIVSGTIFYSKYLADKIALKERQKVQEWVEASNSLLNPNNNDTRLPLKIIQDNDDIPIIVTNEKDSITGFLNLDSAKVNTDKNYLARKLSSLKSINDPITWQDPLNPSGINKYYFGHTSLLNEVQYYPIVQLIIIGLFITVIIVTLRGSYRSAQNQVWAGMAKETAHQLGTPVSSLEGWVEMMKQTPAHEKLAYEIEKDVDRLRLVSDRFGKIGSKPQLEEKNLVLQIENIVEYMRKRAAGKVSITFNYPATETITAHISGPLFDWVLENLLKNALDALEGKGSITVDLINAADKVYIDVTDTGKGISSQHIAKVFNPGFTTKKRGWGLGLSLSKRIMVQYHQGEIFVKHSELGKGTIFRIVLKK
jgi:signal transduction histidine kinase